jgi:hypothetical protein
MTSPEPVQADWLGRYAALVAGPGEVHASLESLTLAPVAEAAEPVPDEPVPHTLTPAAEAELGATAEPGIGDRAMTAPGLSDNDPWADPEWVSGKAMLDYLRGDPWPAPEPDPEPEPEAEL